jgi:hypothetical protein
MEAFLSGLLTKTIQLNHLAPPRQLQPVAPGHALVAMANRNESPPRDLRPIHGPQEPSIEEQPQPEGHCKENGYVGTVQEAIELQDDPRKWSPMRKVCIPGPLLPSGFSWRSIITIADFPKVDNPSDSGKRLIGRWVCAKYLQS